MIATLPFLVAFGGTLLVFDPIQRVARLCGTRIAVERAHAVDEKG